MSLCHLLIPLPHLPLMPCLILILVYPSPSTYPLTHTPIPLTHHPFPFLADERQARKEAEELRRRYIAATHVVGFYWRRWKGNNNGCYPFYIFTCTFFTLLFLYSPMIPFTSFSLPFSQFYFSTPL